MGWIEIKSSLTWAQARARLINLVWDLFYLFELVYELIYLVWERENYFNSSNYYYKIGIFTN